MTKGPGCPAPTISLPARAHGQWGRRRSDRRAGAPSVWFDAIPEYWRDSANEGIALAPASVATKSSSLGVGGGTVSGVFSKGRASPAPTRRRRGESAWESEEAPPLASRGRGLYGIHPPQPPPQVLPQVLRPLDP